MWHVVGHKRAVSMLQNSLESGTLAHAYLIAGPAHVGKMTLALNLAQALNCEADEKPCLECPSCRKIESGGHADVQVIGLIQNDNTTEAKLIHTEQIKQMLHSASLPPFEGNCKVFIIDGAELLSIDAANRLLKTLEEPVSRVVFILLTVDDSLVPATVVSRCQRLELPPVAVSDIESLLLNSGIGMERAGIIARLAHGCPGWALSASAEVGLLEQRDGDMDRLLAVIDGDSEERFNYANQLATRFNQKRSSVYGTLELWLDFWRDIMLVKTGCREMVTNIDRLDRLAEIATGYTLAGIRSFIESIRSAKEQLQQNANPRLVLEVLMLDIPRKDGEEELVTQLNHG